MAKDKKVNIIFTIIKQYDAYKALSNMITGSSFGELKRGSKNMVDLVKKEYRVSFKFLNISSCISVD